MSGRGGGDHGLSSSLPADDDLAIGVLVTAATLAAAVVGQGAFEGPSRWLVAAGLAAALVTSVRRPLTATTRIRNVGVAALALIAWIAFRGVTTSSASAATAQIGLIVGTIAIVVVCRRATAAERDALVTTVIAAGVFVAISGWVGVAFRVEPWANPGPTTWRASSSLTYPNAAAAVIVVALMFSLARRIAQPTSRIESVVCCVLIAGLLATQSRGGAVALGVGLLAMLMLGGWRVGLRAVLVPSMGAVLGFVVCLPGLDPISSAQPIPALVGLGIGAALAAALPNVSGRSMSIGATLALIGVPAAVWLTNEQFGRIGSDRVQLGSDDRAATMRRAVDAIVDAPIAGVGPGNLNLVWRSGDQLVTTGLVHNEYLQLIAELGIVGGAILVVLLVGAIRLLAAARTSTDQARWAGGAAALAALAVHSGFDFLWHIPAIPLLAATIFGITTGRVGPHAAISTTTTNTSNQQAPEPTTNRSTLIDRTRRGTT
jgi:O-antigen ligase